MTTDAGHAPRAIAGSPEPGVLMQPATSPDNPLVANVQYGYQLGWSFTPLHGKKPFLDGWSSLPKESMEEAMAWAAQGNVGLRTGRISSVVAIDLDEYKPIYDPDAVAALNLPATVTTITGGGGRCLLYASTAAVGNSAGKLAPAVDVKGDGGQVVFPGSIHPETGASYTWVEGRSPWEIELATLPVHVVEHLAAKPTHELPDQPPRPTDAERRAVDYLQKMPPAVSGQRGHDATYAAATALVHGFGLHPDRAFQLLLEHHNHRCQPPWTEAELRHKVRDAAEKTHKKPYGWLRDADPVATGTAAPDVILLPSATTRIIDSAKAIFIRAADRRTLFIRGRVVHEISPLNGQLVLVPVTADMLRSRVEHLAQTMRWISDGRGGAVLKPSRPKAEDAKGILDSPEVALLPPIDTIFNSPVLRDGPDGPRLLNKGYHQVGNEGVFITSGQVVGAMELFEATGALRGLLTDFEFVERADEARALAALVTPALRFGRFFVGHAPLLVLEADQPQAGKGYFVTLLTAT